MWSTTTIAIALLTLVAVGRRADAQERFEVGGGIAFAGLQNGGDFWGPGVRHGGGVIQATLPLGPTLALDIATTLGRRTIEPMRYSGYKIEGGETTRIEGLYSFAVKKRVGWDGHSGSYGYFSCGLAGTFVRSRVAERQETSPVGYVSTERGYTYVEKGGAVTIVGGGFERAITSRLSMRGDMHVLWFLWYPVGFRTSAAVVVPLGMNQ